jgi:hypothetical protein
MSPTPDPPNPNPEVGPPGLGSSSAGHAEAMERRRRRLCEAAGVDPCKKTQAEFIIYYQYWRADRWDVESRWKPHVAKELCLGSNPWVPHQYYLDCRTEAIARNACRTLRKNFPASNTDSGPSDGSMPRK